MDSKNAINYSLDQIVNILTQQMQLMRGTNEKLTSSPVFGASSGTANPFSLGGGYSSSNPFSSGFSAATGATGAAGGMFGGSMIGKLGIGLGATLLERKIIDMTNGSLDGLGPTSFGFFSNKTKISNMDRAYAAANFGDKMVTGGLAFSSMLLNTFGGIPGMVAGTILNISADQARQQNAYNKYLLRNSNRFINYGESNNNYGLGGFNMHERMEAATFLRKFGTENWISDRDTQQLLQSFTEGDLLRQTKDLKSFKENMTKLTKAVKEGAVILGETYQSMTNLMTDLKKLGMDPTKAASYVAGASAIQGLTGLDAVAARTGLLSFAGSMAQGTGMSAGNLYENYTQKLLYTNAMYDDLYQKAQSGDQTAQRMYNLIVNNGGTEGAYQAVATAEQQVLASNNGLASTIGVLYHDYNQKSGTWEFDEGAFRDIINGDQTNLVERANQKLNAVGAIAANSWLSQGSEYMMSNLNSAQQAEAMKGYLNYLQNQKSQFRGQNLNTTQQLQILLGMTGDQTELYAQTLDYMMADGGDLIKKYEALKTSQEMLADMNTRKRGAGYAMKNFFEGVKDELAPDWFVEGANKVGQRMQNWWKGYTYEVADVSSKHGAEDWEDSIKKVSKALDDLSKSAERTGNSLGVSKDKLDGLKSSVDSMSGKSTDASVSADYVSSDNLYKNWKSATNFRWSAFTGGTTWGATIGGIVGALGGLAVDVFSGGTTGGAGTITGAKLGMTAGATIGSYIGGQYAIKRDASVSESEREEYTESLRGYLGKSYEDSKYDVILAGADKAEEYAEKLRSKDTGTEADRLSWAKYLTSYNGMYGDYLSKEAKEQLNTANTIIAKDSSSDNSKGSGMNKTELESGIKKAKDKIKDLEGDLAKATANGGYYNGKSRDDIQKEINEQVDIVNNFELVRDETKTSQNQINVAANQMAKIFGIDDKDLKDRDFMVEGKKIDELSYSDVMGKEASAESYFAQRAISQYNLNKEGFSRSSFYKAYEKAFGAEAAQGLDSADKIAEAAGQLFRYNMDSVNAAVDTDENGNVKDKTQDYIDSLSSASDEVTSFTDALKDATAAAQNFATKAGTGNIK